MADSAKDVLYHYCSLDTFFNIMKNRSIWLSDVSKSNDAQELSWITRQLKSSLSCYFFKFYDRIREKGLLEQLNDPEYKEIIGGLDNLDLSKTLKCWAFCLSEKEDNLGQWRGYADDGQGLAIGFKREFFASKPGNTELLDIDKSYGIFDCVKYGDLDVIKEFLGDDEIKEVETTLDFKVLIRLFKTALAKTILLDPLYKNLSFQEEAEWRLACVVPTSKILLNNFNPADNEHWLSSMSGILRTKHYSFSPQNQTLVSHIELQIENMKSAIASVTIGPKSKLTILDVKLFLVSLGLIENYNDESIAVIQSKASYR